MKRVNVLEVKGRKPWRRGGTVSMLLIGKVGEN